MEAARDQAFSEFVFAVELGQAAGNLRKQTSAHDIGRVLTGLVDGYLFHTLVERVDTGNPVQELDGYIQLAIEGLGRPDGVRDRP